MKNLYKFAAILSIIVVVVGIFVFGGDSVEVRPEPYRFQIEYMKDGHLEEMDLTADDFGKSILVSCDTDTGVIVSISRSRDTNFNLTETMFSVIGGRTEHSSNMGNEYFNFTAGQSGILSLNYGTEEAPSWVSLKIETVC